MFHCPYTPLPKLIARSYDELHEGMYRIENCDMAYEQHYSRYGYILRFCFPLSWLTVAFIFG